MISCIHIFIFLALISTVFAWPRENEIKKEHGVRVEVGSMIAEIARELVQRSSTNSQVLSLNLSSLLLLMVLKAIVFGAGYMGHHGYKARDLNEESIISESEVALALSYLVGDSCLHKAACEVPHQAEEYVGAAEMLLQSIRIMPWYGKAEYEKYDKMISELKKAVEYGLTRQCPSQYTCKKEYSDV